MGRNPHLSTKKIRFSHFTLALFRGSGPSTRNLSPHLLSLRFPFPFTIRNPQSFVANRIPRPTDDSPLRIPSGDENGAAVYVLLWRKRGARCGEDA